ncbi:hypothetical protein AX774_g437 [Zancudomyces culisetae]|uniref:Uncharacterized protein n=1 Tax=Zancudomyces culisetae TaxID=1213189 RepID=A0A1R1PI01_ZANCU|nr:hypothetical protein AX774_g5986 [Zancudomyces culisetae]OMH86018.1 hypothetical protein AX774_g437 [Zancudomyces culisetae]|eukprot:OMH80577.1 hypothetical protein AX774_g5986 [Zancudomyces culisetae]
MSSQSNNDSVKSTTVPVNIPGPKARRLSGMFWGEKPPYSQSYSEKIQDSSTNSMNPSGYTPISTSLKTNSYFGSFKTMIGAPSSYESKDIKLAESAGKPEKGPIINNIGIESDTKDGLNTHLTVNHNGQDRPQTPMQKMILEGWFLD